MQISGSTYQPDNTTINVTFNVTNSPVIQINNSQIVLTGYTGGPDVTVPVSFANVGLGSLSIDRVRRNVHGKSSQCLGLKRRYDPDYRQPIRARRRHLSDRNRSGRRRPRRLRRSVHRAECDFRESLPASAWRGPGGSSTTETANPSTSRAGVSNLVMRSDYRISAAPRSLPVPTLEMPPGK